MMISKGLSTVPYIMPRELSMNSMIKAAKAK
jgi:hypothetical protein